MAKEELFTYVDSDNVEQNVNIDENSFDFVQKDTSIHDVKFETKPTTFFKDAFRRFRKNKSSVAGGIILGILVLLSLVLPVAIPYDTTSPHTYEIKLPAKLFSAGTGWWDGTTSFENFTYDNSTKLPAEVKGDKNAYSVKKTYDEYIYTNNIYAKGGDVRLLVSSKGDYYYASSEYNYDLNSFNYNLKFDTIDDKDDDSYFNNANYSVVFSYYNEALDAKEVVLKTPSKEVKANINIDLASAFENASNTDKVINKAKIKFIIHGDADVTSDVSEGILLNNLILSKKDKTGADVEDSTLAEMSITDSNGTVCKTKGPGVWTSTATVSVNKAILTKCDYTVDNYLLAYGDVDGFKFGKSEIDDYIANGWCTYNYGDPSSLVILNDTKCPIRAVSSEEIKSGNTYVIGTKSQYRYLGYDSVPLYLFGTDADGKDLLKLVFSGLRTSLILGFCTFLVCFTFGLIWGSISGYFGGAVDLLMERFCDILGGIPWIVLMTLIIIKYGNSFLTFAVALCITGWMGTAARTRTQFYRFKGREYILASRTLGASDNRLIFKHILPNAMGTIITSAVLMIPSVIFSEATMSYLNLGLQGLDSLGVILSSNQQFIETNPTLILFPSVVMALIMISFNLFGNGLRDAFNPSLKGAE